MRFSDLPALRVIGVLVVAGCADLALEPDQIPASMTIAPADTLITEGDAAKLTVTVLDEDGNRIPGPPSWAPPEWTPNDPSKIDIAPDGSLIGLGGADLKVTAELAGLEAWTGLRINPNSVVFSAGAIYLTQGMQNVDGSVPIIAGRDAFLRVFGIGDEISFYKPRARAVFYQDGEVVHSAMMNLIGDVLPEEVTENRLDQSFNVEIPGEVLQPGVTMVIELDPDGVVPAVSGSRLRIPAEGAMELDVVEMPLLEQIIVPILVSSAPDERVFLWTRGMNADSKHLYLARSVLPIGEMDVTVHETYYTTTVPIEFSQWNRLLREIRTLRLLENVRGYHYGVLERPPGSSIAGLGYIGQPVSIGRTNEGTYAHELGHNVGLRHAPCGSASGPDPDYPYDNGDIGVWGYDLRRSRLLNPEQYSDLMGYCRPRWISDFSFLKAMDYRLNQEDDVLGSDVSDPALHERTLMLWGSAGNGELLLEPAFMIDAPPTLPDEDGPYRLEGFGPGGELHFSLSFTPAPVEFGGGHFQFAVPHDPDTDGALERVVLSGPEGEFTLGRSSTPPMAIIRSRTSGQVRAIIRDWSGGFSRIEGSVEIMVSNGLPGGTR